MRVKIFWHSECPNCPEVKAFGENLIKEGINVEFWNTKEVDGLAEALFYDILATPAVILIDGNDRQEWRTNVEVNEIWTTVMKLKT